MSTREYPRAKMSKQSERNIQIDHEHSTPKERKEPVTEFEIMQQKLRKAKVAMARGFLQRKQAVDRNIARR